MPVERDMFQMENCVCFNLRRISRAITQFLVGELGHHGLMPTQTPILRALAMYPDATMAILSDGLGMDRTTLVRNLQPLERDGLVKLSGKGRGRKVTIRLTPAGHAALDRFMPDWKKAQARVLTTLGESRWVEILGDLDRAAVKLNT